MVKIKSPAVIYVLLTVVVQTKTHNQENEIYKSFEKNNKQEPCWGINNRKRRTQKLNTVFME